MLVWASSGCGRELPTVILNEVGLKPRIHLVGVGRVSLPTVILNEVGLKRRDARRSGQADVLPTVILNEVGLKQRTEVQILDHYGASNGNPE